MMKNLFYICILSLLFLSSCKSGSSMFSSSKSGSGYKGISRVRTYEFTHPDVPTAFDGFRIAFISDLHYRSLFKEKGLANLVKLLNNQHADALLIGGDLHEGCEYVQPLFGCPVRGRKHRWGTYVVLGNNDYEACYDDIVHGLQKYGMHLLEHKVDTLRRDGEEILIAGVRNPFNLKKNGTSPTLGLSPDDFVILLTHTPDYAEDVPITNTDLVLAGHTHGGQVTLFGLYAPIHSIPLWQAFPHRIEIQLASHTDDYNQWHRYIQ